MYYPTECNDEETPSDVFASQFQISFREEDDARVRVWVDITQNM